MDKYPASYTYLPADFGDARSDNGTVLDFGERIYKDPFQVLEPAACALGVNKKSTKISTRISFGEIYVIWAIGTTLYKIGVSTDFKRRFKDLSASSPLPLTPVKYARCDNPHLLESRLHAMFAAKVFKNEWFSLDENDLARIAAMFDRYFDKTAHRLLESPCQATA